MACHPAPNPTEAQPESSSDIRDAIKKQVIVESKHQRYHAADYFFIHDICNQLGLLSKEVNQDDMSGYLTEINEKWKERWHEADWRKSYIWSVESALTILRQAVQSPNQDLSPSLKTNLENAIVQLRVSILSHHASGQWPEGDGKPAIHKIRRQGVCWQQREPLEHPYQGHWQLGNVRAAPAPHEGRYPMTPEIQHRYEDHLPFLRIISW